MPDEHITDTALQIFCAILQGENPMELNARIGTQRAETAFTLAAAFHQVAAERERAEQQQQTARRYLSGPRGERP